jgi:tRNA nucleotidyltransferase (CCA-adding enzyme)
LPEAVGTALAAVIKTAEAQGRTLYLVGGCVRDLALGRDLVDVDLVAEREVESLAATAAAAVGGRSVAHDEFGTVTLEVNEARVDLAMARAESYVRPGALPRVRPAAIEQDLARRDFTINAIALGLCGPERGRLLDPFGGWEDLRRGLVRILHDHSFIDDATRILRAVRYAARLGFRLEKETKLALRRDVSYLDTISGARLRQELLRLLAEERPETTLLLCQRLGVLEAVHPALRFDRRLAVAFRAARRWGAPLGPELRLALLGTPLSPDEAGGVARRLVLSARERRALEGAAGLGVIMNELARPRLRPSRAVELLGPYPEPNLWAWSLVAPSPTVRRRLRRYLEVWRYVQSTLDGRALDRLGVPHGPLVGEAMRMLRAARLDGHVRSRKGEVAVVRRLLAGRGGS